LKTFNQISKSFNYFTFPIVNLPFISSNIPAQPAYVIYMSKLIRYSRDRVQHSDFLDIVQLLTQKLPKKGYVAPMLKSSQKKKKNSKKKFKWEWIFSILRRFFQWSIDHRQDFYNTYLWVTRRVPKKQEPLTLRKQLGSFPGFVVGSMLLIVLVFCVVFLGLSSLCVLSSLLHVSVDFSFLIARSFFCIVRIWNF
jgi:hypothetical protein